ncbi:MAG: tRNA lysidine(34) synthetase TilS [Rikenellaceae bacterium]|nr:tRNA lysidine(34) synthetase TilS [Rikenellaceae bacterium]
MGANLLYRFNKYIKDNDLLERDDKVLVAVSGGVDSMVLMNLLVEAGYKCGVAHCNFQLRGEEAFEDEVLVRREAEKLGLPHYNVRFDTAGEMERTGESVQIAARRLRYDWFRSLCDEYGYTVVAIAHHADDSIETFFINLFRGTGLKGLTGISRVNGRVVRPLLFASRREIADYAALNAIPYREDSSNRSTKYLRNKIRLGLIPRIKEINPAFTEVMGANVLRLTDAQMFIDSAIENIRAGVEEQRDGIIVIDPSRIDPSYPHHFVIYELLTRYGFRGTVVDGLCHALEHGQTGKKFYAKDYVAYIDRGRIMVSPVTEGDACGVEIDRDMKKAYCGNSVYYFRFLDIDNVDTLNVPEHVALLDADKLAFPLHARRWEEGDSFVPLGMTGRKKVSDYLIDRKVPMAEKNRQFVVLSGEDIVWLAGRRIDDRYRITDSTENILQIVKEII